MCQKISVIKTNSYDDIKKIVQFGILIHILPWRQQKLKKTLAKTQVFVMITEIFWRTFWRTFWQQYLSPYKTPAKGATLDILHNFLIINADHKCMFTWNVERFKIVNLRYHLVLSKCFLFWAKYILINSSTY